MSAYSPLFYFVQQAHFTKDQAVEFIQEAKCGLKGTRTTVIRRLQGTQSIRPMSTVDKTTEPAETLTIADIQGKLSAAKSLMAKRTILWRALRRTPEIVQSAMQPIFAKPLLEAITHLDKSECVRHAEALKQILLGLFGTEFQKLDGIGQSMFRKAAAYLDEQLNKSAD